MACRSGPGRRGRLAPRASAISPLVAAIHAGCARLAVSDQLADGDLLELDRLVDSHNLERSGIQDASLLSIMLRSPEGPLFAGLHGYTWGGYCEVKSLWVAKERRGNGLGSLLLTSAEEEAARRGCRQVLLTTHSFQAPAFYRRHGYREVVSVSDCPVGHAYILMAKALHA